MTKEQAMNVREEDRLTHIAYAKECVAHCRFGLSGFYQVVADFLEHTDTHRAASYTGGPSSRKLRKIAKLLRSLDW
jgi:hypothetical protein